MAHMLKHMLLGCRMWFGLLLCLCTCSLFGVSGCRSMEGKQLYHSVAYLREILQICHQMKPLSIVRRTRCRGKFCVPLPLTVFNKKDKENKTDESHTKDGEIKDFLFFFACKFQLSDQVGSEWQTKGLEIKDLFI